MLTFFTHVEPWTPPFARTQASHHPIPLPSMPPRRSVSMGSSLDHVDKDVYYWEPKSLRIRRCEPGKPMGNPYGFLWRFPREAWGKNPGFFPSSIGSSLCPHWRTAENGPPGDIGMIGSGQIFAVVLTAHVMVHWCQCIPLYSDAERLLNHQRMILNWMNTIFLFNIVMENHHF